MGNTKIRLIIFFAAPKVEKLYTVSTNLNQTPYNYTGEVTNRFKGLDVINRVPEELWMEIYNTVQEAVIKTSPRKRNAKRQNDCLRRPYKWLWRRKWQPTPVPLPGKSDGRRSLVGYSPWGHKELDMTERLHFHFHYKWLRKEEKQKAKEKRKRRVLNLQSSEE